MTRSYNPYRTTSDETYGWTDTTYDGLGRATRVETFDRFGASTVAVTTAYAGNGTTVTDQAGKVRRSITDGLGRLVRVDEPEANGNLGAVTAPIQPTSYVYDVLDDLAKVTQGGQTRFFMYDSLKELIRASNPEQNTNASIALTDPLTGNSQWSMKYVYDANSNLSQKVDPRNITCNYVYDALNRVTSRSYIGDPSNTPAVTYSYDALPVLYSKGRLTQVSSSVSTLDYLEYDQLGRVKQTRQTTAGGDASGYTTSYGYNLAGEMISEIYPSGKEIKTSYDSAGRVGQVSRYIAAVFDKTYASTFSYAAHGATKSFQLGNSKWEHTNFNSRVQPLQIGLGTSDTNSSILQLDYGYGATNSNNGNVLSQTITIGVTVMTQSYGYDALNRLSSASEGPAWSQTYDCDRYGNRAVRVGSYIPTPALTPQSVNSTDFSAFSQSTNKIIRSGFGYDSAGNLTSDPTTAANAMVDDAENRQISYTKTGVTTTYSYDGDGRRVKKVDSTGTIIFVYNAGGQLIAEYHSDPVPPPAGGGGTSYLTSDHLGSTRVVTKSDGTVKARYDYLPFGEELGATIGQRTTGMGYNLADSTKQKFTQKERDNESGLDYFGARYYSSAQGRFTSPDKPFVNQLESDPQTWNLYMYARKNPLLYVDPTGEDYVLYEYNYDEEKKAWVRTGNTYQVADIANLPKGYTVYGGNENTVYVQGPNGTRFTAQYIAGDPGGVSVQAQYTISALGDGVGAELDRSAQGSRNLIGGFAGVTAAGGAIAGAAAYVAPAALPFIVRAVEKVSVTGPSIAVTLLSKAQDPKLRNIINDLYRVAAKIGSGSSADAFRADGSHALKLEYSIRGLQNVLKNPNLSQTDRDIANYLINDMKNALSGK